MTEHRRLIEEVKELFGVTEEELVDEYTNRVNHYKSFHQYLDLKKKGLIDTVILTPKEELDKQMADTLKKSSFPPSDTWRRGQTPEPVRFVTEDESPNIPKDFTRTDLDGDRIREIKLKEFHERIKMQKRQKTLVAGIYKVKDRVLYTIMDNKQMRQYQRYSRTMDYLSWFITAGMIIAIIMITFITVSMIGEAVHEAYRTQYK